MRIIIEIDDVLMAEAMALISARTKKEAVETALRELVRRHKTANAIRSLRGKIQWEGDLDAMRRGDAATEWSTDGEE